jgi:hypothetical protein
LVQQLVDTLALVDQRLVREFELLAECPDSGLKCPDCPPDIVAYPDRGSCCSDMVPIPRIGVFLEVLRVVERDKYPDNAIVADLAPPVFSPDKTLGGRNGYPATLCDLGIGHAASAVADRKRNVRHRIPLSARARQEGRRPGEMPPTRFACMAAGGGRPAIGFSLAQCVRDRLFTRRLAAPGWP